MWILASSIYSLQPKHAPLFTLHMRDRKLNMLILLHQGLFCEIAAFEHSLALLIPHYITNNYILFYVVKEEEDLTQSF